MPLRRILVLSLLLLLSLTAVSALLEAGTDPAPTTSTSAAEREATPAEGRPATARAPAERDPSPPGDAPRVLSAQASGQHVEVPAGEDVRLQVRTDEPLAVQVGSDGPIEVANADSPAEFSLFAEPGLDAPVVVLQPRRVIGRVTARP